MVNFTPGTALPMEREREREREREVVGKRTSFDLLGIEPSSSVFEPELSPQRHQ
jgi:hypothetical protein